MSARSSWALEQGDELSSGLLALDHLGGGEVFETYLAWDSRMYTVVVAKVVRPALVDEAWARAALQTEAEMLDRLDHPFLVRSFGGDLDGRRPHLRLEHVDGPTLHSVVTGRRAGTLEELLPLALHICSALHYLSTLGIVHMDIKPRNIIMGPSPRLIDFSLARSPERIADIRVPTGTADYMSPEQARVDPELISPRSDIWGLAVTLYQAALGRLPFPPAPDPAPEGADLPTRFPCLAHGPMSPGRDLPAELSDVLMRCLRDDPDARPAPSEVVLALEPLVARLPRPVAGRRRLLFL